MLLSALLALNLSTLTFDKEYIKIPLNIEHYILLNIVLGLTIVQYLLMKTLRPSVTPTSESHEHIVFLHVFNV